MWADSWLLLVWIIEAFDIVEIRDVQRSNVIARGVRNCLALGKKRSARIHLIGRRLQYAYLPFLAMSEKIAVVSLAFGPRS